MILFWSLAAALTVAALAFLLPPLLRSRVAPPDARVAANAAVYREQLEELGAELQRGALTREEYERASREVERRIVDEHGGGAGAPEAARHRAPAGVAVAVGLLVPLAAALGYWQLGEPRALQAEALRHADPEQLRALSERLAAHLQKTPDDIEGWSLLGRALLSQDRYDGAARAFAHAVKLSPENHELLVEFIKALALAGRAEFEQRNYAAAIGYWERILPFAAPESEFTRTVNESIAEAKALAGEAAPAPPRAGAAAPAAKAIRGVVSLDPKLKGKAAPGDTVFVLARPASGSRMPLAVARTTVDKLPYSFTLDDSMAMSPDAKLSGHAKVVVVARVSKSGTAMPQKGDIEGVSAEVKPGDAGVKVLMSTLRD